MNAISGSGDRYNLCRWESPPDPDSAVATNGGAIMAFNCLPLLELTYVNAGGGNGSSAGVCVANRCDSIRSQEGCNALNKPALIVQCVWDGEDKGEGCAFLRRVSSVNIELFLFWFSC